MAAIDLLLNWSPTSERMHQAVLDALFHRTRLLELLGIPGVPAALEIETQGRLYDFTVSLDTGRKVHIELKVDATLEDSQVKRQMVAVPAGDLLLYVLLGTARFSWNRRKLEAIRQKAERAPDAESVRLIDLQGMWDALAELASHATDPDHRDLVVAYGSLLRRIDSFTGQFESKPLPQWEKLDWYGFFGKLIADMQLPDAGMGYVANKRGGFVGCWWDLEELPFSPGAKVYLQLEERLLCFKVAVEKKDDQASVRQAFSDAVLGAARQFGFNAKRPGRFGRGTYMTVAVLDGEYRTGPSGTVLDWAHTRNTITAAGDVLAAAVMACAPHVG